jgi:enoyl-CoA hydratase/carnithine racemase
MDIMMTARKFDASEAERIGLVNRCFAAENFLEHVLAYAEDIAKNVSPRSVKIMKRQIYTALGEDIQTNLDSSMEEMLQSFGSEDFKEGVKHFIEKRPAKFTGK